MVKEDKQKKKEKGISMLFIPAGLFIGMGLGFFYDQLVAGMYIGLGAGFVLAIIGYLVKKK